MSTLLIVDDEPNVLYSLEKGLRSESLHVVTASTGQQAIDSVRQNPPDAVILDVRLPDLPGLEVFDQIRKLNDRLPIIVATAFASTETAIEAMKRGAFEYLLKPVSLPEVRSLVQRALELNRLRCVPAVLDEEPENTPGDRIVGHSTPMQEVYKAVGRVAPQDVTVLILGESGTGKELIARAILHHSRRNTGPFLAMNCAAIPETLLESELFGHERGAFTGADHLRIGKFEQSNRGTLFLDELGDMSLGTQAKILRVLQDGRFERLGGSQSIQTDVRIIAATNQDLEKMVEEGRFRRDLFYRLNDYTIRLPALRDRLDDLPLLIEHLLKVFNPLLRKEVRGVSPEALEILRAHSWPGNVRELQGVIKFALIQAKGEVLSPDCLPPVLQAPASSNAEGQDIAFDLRTFVREMIRSGSQEIYWKIMAEVDRVVLEETLQHLRGSQVQASELLGISRTTLRNKLASLGLTVSKQVQPDSVQPG